MNKRTIRLVRMVSDMRRARHCTALRAAHATAEADAELARAADASDAEERDDADKDDMQQESGSRIRSPSR